MSNRPLILSPAGSFEALTAALDAGADEVYFGLHGHNARQNAKNFTADETKEALKKCKLRGVKSNITLNTLVTDREIKEAVGLAYDALCMGADAFIVQDLGLAAALKKAVPEIVLHASTQCACHSKEGARQLAELGFERVVLARELDAEEIKSIVSLGIETEIFVHGALCVCHSGMCLMSSVIGKRSGNRGLCAQPCRLPYNFGSKKAEGKNGNFYPLSLKDLSLARHIPDLSELGVTSLKIEGRMKPADYVSGVTSVWKTLVTENRNATDEEYSYLERLFSRSGFTDGYFTGKYRDKNRNMYGVRTESDKKDTKELESKEQSTVSKRSVAMSCFVEEGNSPILEISTDGYKYTAVADFTAQTASSRPATAEDINTSLAKLGDTDFVCENINTEISGNVFIAKSQLNALRRSAVAGLENEILASIPKPRFDESAFFTPDGREFSKEKQLRLFPSSLASLQWMLGKYKDYSIESVCLPLGMFAGYDGENAAEFLKSKNTAFGVKLPRVVFSCEEQKALELLTSAKNFGAVYGLAENISHVPLIKASGLKVFIGAAMNVFNSHTVRVLKDMGAESVTLSTELLTAQMRDIDRGGISNAVVASGRLELMVLESCIIKANGGCKSTKDGQICSEICDRTGAVFPIKCERRLTDKGFPCRNIILNSVPLGLFDKKDELAKTGANIYCIYED